MQGTGQRDRKDVRCRTRDGAIARTRRRAGAGEARASWKTAGTSASGIFATHTHESRSSRSTLSSCSVAMCVSTLLLIMSMYPSRRARNSLVR